ncbi:MAG: type II secretion system F family protein, partial [Candidatus Omnitrophota bacterium]
MKTFIYKAKEGPDKITEGKMAAVSAEDVVEKLNRLGYTATYVKEVQDAYSGRGENRGSLKQWHRFLGVGNKELITFTVQLANLLKSGVPILRALSILREQTHNRYLEYALGNMILKVKGGESFSSVMGDYPEVFSQFYVAMVRAGEDSGSIDKSLARVANYYKGQYELVSKVKSALAYPILITAVGLFTLIFIFTAVIPRLLPLLMNMNAKLPLPTLILIRLSVIVEESWFWIVLVIAIFVLIFRNACRNRAFRARVSHMKLRIPLFGDLVFKSEFAKFAQGLAISLESGIPIIKSMDVSVPIVRELAVRDCLEHATAQLHEIIASVEVSRQARKEERKNLPQEVVIVFFITVSEGQSFDEVCGCIRILYILYIKDRQWHRLRLTLSGNWCGFVCSLRQ